MIIKGKNKEKTIDSLNSSNLFVIKLKLITFLVLCHAQLLMAQYTMDWAKAYGGEGWDEANTVLELKDGTLLVGGFARLGEQHMWLIRITPEGHGFWGKTFHKYYTSSAESMIQDKDSNIVIAGYRIEKNSYESDLWVIKIKPDTAGTVLWEKFFGKDGDEQASCIIETSDGGYAICGYTTSNRDYLPDWYILKLDKDGNLVWDKEFGGPKDDRALAITELYNGNLAVTGYTGYTQGNYRSLSVIMFDSDGNDLWAKNIKVKDLDVGTSVVGTQDSCIIIVGYTRYLPIVDYDAMMMKMDMQGEIIWQQLYGWGDWEEASKVVATYDGCYAMGGFSKSNDEMKAHFIVAKYDKMGNRIWSKVFKRKSLDYARGMVETIDNSLVMVGSTYSQGSGWDYAVLKFRSDEISTITFNSPRDSISASPYPVYNVDACIKSIGVIQNITILVNGDTAAVKNDFVFKQKSFEDECDFVIQLPVNLRLGKNYVVYLVTDHKGYVFSKERYIYYLPPAIRTW